MLRFDLWIARRLSLRSHSEKNTNRAAAGSIVAIVGIALSIAIMIIAQAIVTGFKNEIKNKIAGFNSQISVYPANAYSNEEFYEGIQLTPELSQQIETSCPNATATLSLRQPSILKTDSAFLGVVLRGSTPSPGIDFINSNLVAGMPLPVDVAGNDTLINTIIISKIMADALNLAPGDKINTHFILDNTLRTRRLTVRGIYNTHFSDYDEIFAYTPLEFLQNFSHLDSVTGSVIEVWNVAQTHIEPYSLSLQNALTKQFETSQSQQNYIVSTIFANGAIYYNWLSLLDTNVLVIIILMACVSIFTLISSLFIIILERVNMIGLFKALGASNKNVRSIFICMTQRLVAKGLVLGNLVALSLLIIQHQLHIFPLDAGSYYVDFVPVSINWASIVITNICAAILSAAVLIIPSGAISRLKPADTIRFE